MNTIISETIEAGQTNKVKFAYDNLGRVSSKTYTNSNNVSYVESYVYNSYGFLDQVKFNNTVVYDVSTMDTRGNITAASIGGTAAVWSYDTYGTLTAIAAAGVQSYLFNFNTSTGNLTSRTRTTNSITETFTYDNSDRLTGATSTGATLAMGYDAKGNLTSKSDAGTLVYDNGSPYQLAHVNPYTSAFPADSQSITYTSYGQVNTIYEGSKNVTFKYNSDKQRVKMTYTQNGSVTKTKYYFGSSYEKEVSGTIPTEYIWIGGDAYTAVAVAKIVNNGTPQVWSIFRDHLGSITHLKNGTTVQEYSYDAWGRRRNPTSWDYNLSGQPALIADRGFTGHEHLTEFGLINMNGRLYDPLVGRFLSPDNYVQDASNSQNFNRYGYCLNNPLVYTDPDGEFIIEAILIGMTIAGAYYGGAAVNSETGSFDGLKPEWDPTKWKWKGEGAWKTYAGMIGGGAVGYLGGAMAVEYLAGDAAISLGFNFEGLVKVGAAFTKEGLQYLGYSTIAGGGLLVTGAAVNSWMKKTPSEGYERGNTSSIVYPSEHTDAFDGPGGKARYFLLGPNVGNSRYSMNGNYLGPSMITGMAPAPGSAKGGTVFIKGFGAVEKGLFHLSVKPDILNAAGKFSKVVGRNPDIAVKEGLIILKGTGPYGGKVFQTGLKATDFFSF